MSDRHKIKQAAKAKRGNALLRPELRGFDNFTPVSRKMPDEGLACRARGYAHNSQYMLPMLVCRRALQWVNYKTGTVIAANVIAWRYATKQEEKE